MKKTISLLMSVILSLSLFVICPVNAGADTAAPQIAELEKNIKLWEQELQDKKAEKNVLRLTEAMTVGDYKSGIVVAYTHNHPFNMDYWEGFYIRNVPKAWHTRVAEDWYGYVRVLNEPIIYLNYPAGYYLGMGVIATKTCEFAKDIYDLTDKINEAKAKVALLSANMTLNPSSKSYSLTKGESIEISYKLTTTKYKDMLDASGLIWTSSDKKVAKPNAYVKGRVDITARGSGKCTVSAYAKGYKDSPFVKINISVVSYPEKISIEPRELRLAPGETQSLKNVISPSDAVVGSIGWVSSDISIATVNSSGKVRAVAPGTAYIFAYTDNGRVSLSCKVKVTGKKQKIQEVNSIEDAIAAVRTSKYIKDGQKGQYLYTAEDGWYMTYTIEGKEYKVYGYEVKRYYSMKQAVSDLYIRKTDSLTCKCEEFMVYHDGLIDNNYFGSWDFVTDYFDSDEELYEWVKKQSDASYSDETTESEETAETEDVSGSEESDAGYEDEPIRIILGVGKSVNYSNAADDINEIWFNYHGVSDNYTSVWRSGDSSIVKVSKNGKITGVSKGKASVYYELFFDETVKWLPLFDEIEQKYTGVKVCYVREEGKIVKIMFEFLFEVN